MDLGYSTANKSDADNCSYAQHFLRNNTRGFEFERGWDGIPANFIINTVVFIVLIVLFASLRKKAWHRSTSQLSRTHRGWLQFIYGDRDNQALKAVIKVHHSDHHIHDLLNEPTVLTPPRRTNGNQTPNLTDSQSEATQLSQTPPPIGNNTAADQELIEHPSNNGVTASSNSNGSAVNGTSDVKKNSFSRGSVKKKYEPLNDIESQYDSRPSSSDAAEHSQQRADRMNRSMSIDSVTQIGRKLLDALSISDKEIQRVKGVDAVQYLIFQRYLIYFLLLLSVICIVIILPINLQGNIHDKSKPYARTTISNLEASSSLIWAHAIISMLMLPIGIVMMHHFSKIIKTQNEQVAKRTLFIRRIPKSMAVKEGLIRFIEESVPNAKIEGLQFVYDAKNLKYLHQNYINVVNAKYYCREYSEEYRERYDVRPYIFGHFGGLCCCCSCCPKKDGYLFYEGKEQELEKDLEKEYRRTISNPVGSVFITFQSERMAQNVFKYLRDNQEKASFFHCFSCCFRLFNWLMSWCSRKKHDDMKIHQWFISYAPSPEDVYWDNIAVDYGMLWLRRILVHLWLIVIFIFFSTPTVVINILNYLRLTDFVSSGLSQLSPVMTEYFSPLLLIIATMILPLLVTCTCQYLPYKTISEQNHSIMWKVYVFLVLMVIILPSLGLTTAKALLENIASSSEFRWQCMFPADNGAFFVNYVLQSALMGNAFELLRVPELFLYFFATLFYTKTPAEYEAARQQILFDFTFGVRYARFLLLFCMVVSYSLSCPLIAPCGLLYMALKHLVDRYNIYYVYTPSKINDRIHSTAIMFFHIGIFMMQFQVFVYSYLRTNYSSITGLTIISVILSLLYVSGQCLFSCLININHLRYFAPQQRPNKKIEKSEFCACLYLPPVLSELTSNGIQSPPQEMTRTVAKSSNEGSNNSPSSYGSMSSRQIAKPASDQPAVTT